MNDTKVTYIDKSLEYFDAVERAKIGIEFIVANYERHNFTEEDKRTLANYFKDRLLPDPPEDRGYSS